MLSILGLNKRVLGDHYVASLLLKFLNLLDPGATLSFVTPLVDRKFDNLRDILNEPFMVTTPVGDSVVVKRVYRNCPKMFPNKVTHV